MKLIRLCLILLVVFACMAHAESLMFMKAGSIYCPEKYQTELAEIVDATSDHQLKKAVGGAIFAGSCVGASSGPLLVANAIKKITISGNSYFCFDMVDPNGEPFGERHCSPSDSLTTVKEEKERRTGDYEIVVEGEGGLKATCKEGGTIWIRKGERWTRQSMALPAKIRPAEKVISKDKDREIRSGCKGVDYED